MIELSIFDTAMALLPMIVVLIIFVRWGQNVKELGIASLRMVIQLVAIGYALSFFFNYEHLWLGMVVLSIMLIVATFIAMRPQPDRTTKQLYQALIALGTSGLATLIWVTVVVLDLDPWYQPRFIIPLAGMIFANGMNALSLAAERYESEYKQQQEQMAARTTAFRAAMIPQINGFLAVGLVSLPGMMSGQILSGVSPLIAVRYQILVMSMIMCSASLAIMIYLYLRQRTIKRSLV